MTETPRSGELCAELRASPVAHGDEILEGRRMHRNRHLTSFVLVTVLVAACSGGNSRSADETHTPTTSVAPTTTLTPQTTLTSEPFVTVATIVPDTSIVATSTLDGELTLVTPTTPPAGISATTSTLTYEMLGAAGEVVEATATLLVPPGAAPNGGWPLMVWAPGGSGLADICATGTSPDLLGQAAFLAPVIAAGVAVVVPNYEGLGTTAAATYRDTESLAHSTLGAARAAYATGDVALEYALAGYSLGGQAVIAAAERAPEWAPDLRLVQVLAIAPAANGEAQSAHFDEQIAASMAAGDPGGASVLMASKTALLSYLIEGLSVRNPGIQLLDYLGGNAAALAPAVTESCVLDLIVAFISDISAFTANGAAVPDYPGVTAGWFDEPSMAAALSSNEQGTTAIAAPVVVVHGADQIVPNTATLATVDALLATGTNVRYVATAAIDHYGQFNDPQSAAERDLLVQSLLAA